MIFRLTFMSEKSTFIPFHIRSFKRRENLICCVETCFYEVVTVSCFYHFGIAFIKAVYSIRVLVVVQNNYYIEEQSHLYCENPSNGKMRKLHEFQNERIFWSAMENTKEKGQIMRDVMRIRIKFTK